MLQSHVTEVSSSTLPDMVMVKKPKEPKTIKSMQNVPRAKSSKTSEALGGFEPPISCLQDRRITTMLQSHVTEVTSSSTLRDMVMVKKPKSQ